MIDRLPQGFRMRSPEMNDLKAVYEVIEICDTAFFGSADLILDELRTDWLAPTFNLANDAWLITGPDGQVVGYASAGQREHARLYSESFVLPEYAQAGLQDYLLEQVEQWAQEQISQARSDVRISLQCWASNKDEQGQQSLERRGFKEIRRSWNMEIELSEAPLAPEWPSGITMRTFRPGDERAVFDADDEAFRDHWGHMPGNFERFKYWMVERESFDPTLWFLAIDDERIAGMSLCTYRDDLGWVDTLAVLRPWRRRGLGQALMLQSFGEFYRRGTKKVGLGVDAYNLTGATRLYERVGMHVARVYINYEKELRAGIELSTQAILP